MPALLTSTVGHAEVGFALRSGLVQRGPVADVRPIEAEAGRASLLQGLKLRRHRSAGQVNSGHGGARVEQRLAPDRPQLAQRPGYHSDLSRQGASGHAASP